MTYYSFPGLRAGDKDEYLQYLHPGRNWGVAERAKPILKAIEKVTGISERDIKSKSRVRPLPQLRAIVAKHVYVPGKTTLVEIAKELNIRDHTTIYHLFKRVFPIIMNDAQYREMYDNIYLYLSGR